MKGRIIKVFPGGNTSEGFYSYYSFLLEKGTKRIFVIKGGPGVGKSTLMKKIGQKMVDQGYDVEFHYCSSDNNSLDGIAVLNTGVVMVDGTAPHIVDPKYPGGLDEIVNMGEYWNVDGMQILRDKIIASTNEVSRLFTRAYSFLKSARTIADNISVMHQSCMDYAGANKISGILQSMLDGTYRREKIGRERHLFSCAYTPGGFVDFTDSIMPDLAKVYYLEGNMGTGKTTLMQKIVSSAVEKGLNVEIYHTPLMPRKIGAIIIKELNIAITTSEKFKSKNEATINLDQYLDKKMIASFREVIEDDSQLLQSLINKGIDNIRQAKEEHDALEQYYVPNMNFAAANEKYEEILSRIFDLVDNKTMAASTNNYN